MGVRVKKYLFVLIIGISLAIGYRFIELNKERQFDTSNDPVLYNVVQNNEFLEEVLLKYMANDIEGALEIIDSESSIEIASEREAKSSYEILEEYLNANGAYIYNMESSALESYAVGSTDVNMRTVLMVYDSVDNKWLVTGGGHWKNANYLEGIPKISVYTGAKNIGGFDAVGFEFVDTSGTIPTLLSSSGYIHDGNGNGTILYNPSNGNSKHGVVFQYQDEAYYSSNLKGIGYMGYGFSAQGIYNDDFEYYNGCAKSYYAHTGKNGSIESFDINADGFKAVWRNSTDGWELHDVSGAVC